MSDGWNPISDDGKRTATRFGNGYSLYVAVGPIDPTASVRTFRWCGSVHEFAHVEQWLNDGEIDGPTIDVAVLPKAVREKRGQST